MKGDLRRDGLEHEPALRGPSHRHGLPLDESLAEEPALRGTPGLVGYAARYRARRDSTSSLSQWSAVVVAIAASGVLGVFGAFVAATGQASLAAAILAVVVVGPLVEETVKALGAWYLAEQRPWLVPAAWTLIAITVAGGLGFAAIENWIYLNIYIPDPTEGIVRWRWVFGPLIHGTGSLIVGIGLYRMFNRLHRDGEAIRSERVVPWIVAATVVHGTYNGLALLLEATGRLPV